VKSGCVTAISHHHTPRVYLQRFTSRKPKNQLWEYDLTNGAAKQSTPVKSGCEDYYNSVVLTDGRRDDETIEKAFHPLENDLPKLFEAVRNRQEMTEELWGVFFAFVAIQEARCPSTLRTIHDFQRQIHQSGFEMVCNRSVEFRKKLTHAGVEPDRAAAEFELQASKGSALLLSLQAIEETARILSRLRWGFICAPHGKFFFTSDRPMCRWVSRNKRTIYTGGLADRDAEITFPLSRAVCACGHWTKSWPNTYNETSFGMVDTINRRTVWNASQFIYGPRMDIHIMELVKNRRRSRGMDVTR